MLDPAAPAGAAGLAVPLRDRVRFLEPSVGTREQVLAGADVVVLASAGAMPAPGLALAAIGAGVVPLASRLPGLRGGARRRRARPALRARRRRGARRPAAAAGRRPPARAAARRRRRPVPRAARHRARRRRARGGLRDASRRVGAVPAARVSVSARRALIDVDLHMHTDHSPDCATPVEVLLATAREQGLGAIAITDHNEISGALEAPRQGRRDQGDRRRGGQDRRPGRGDRAVPAREDRARHDARRDDRRDPPPGRPRLRPASLRPHARDPRLRAPARHPRRDRRVRDLQPARRDQLVQRGGRPLRRQVPADRPPPARTRTSPPASARCACGCATSTGPQEFLDSLRDAEIHTRPTSLLYVQALKFLETRATPEGARKARRERRVRRAMRKS